MDNKNCEHINLDHEIDCYTIEYCPKMCDGQTGYEFRVFCKDCGKTIYEAGESGHDC